jgi:hypothetical protein
MAALAVARARAILAGLGAPQTPGGIVILVAWQACEGGPASRHNPLNTTLPVPGSYPINAAGVQQYPGEQAGIAATVDTLRNGLYPGIVAALSAGDVAAFLANPQEITRWGTDYGCLAGRFGGPGAAGGGIQVGPVTVPDWAPLALAVIPVGLIVLDDLRRL